MSAFTYFLPFAFSGLIIYAIVALSPPGGDVVATRLECRNGRIVSVLIGQHDAELSEVPVLNISGECKDRWLEAS